MQQPFGSSFKLTVAPTRSWLNLGPGWAMLAGVLTSGSLELKLTSLVQLLILWLLVDPILGALWDLSVQQGLWRRLMADQLPPPPRQGFYLPYAQPNSAAGRMVLRVRCYVLWWQEHYWPELSSHFIAFGFGAVLALLMS